MRYAPSRWMNLGATVPGVVGHTGSTATWLFHTPSLDVIVAGAFDVAQPSMPFRFVPQVRRAVTSARSLARLPVVHGQARPRTFVVRLTGSWKLSVHAADMAQFEVCVLHPWSLSPGPVGYDAAPSRG